MVNVTETDLENIRNYTVYTVLMLVLSRDLAHLKNAGLRLSLTEATLAKIERDLNRLKSEMRRSGLRITSEKISAAGVMLTYTCRKYNSEFSMLPEILRAQSEIKLREYWL